MVEPACFFKCFFTKIVCCMLQFEILKLSKKTIIKPKHLNKTIKIYNGKKHFEFIVTRQMLYLKTGCFISTRSDYFYKKSK